MVSAWLGTVRWLTDHHSAGALNQADVLGLPSGGANQDQTGKRPVSPEAHGTQRLATPRAHVTLQPKIVSVAVSRPRRPSYVNPLRSVSGLVPERIDEGVDFGGSGPVYALGDAIVTNAGENAGWPGGGWITYQLTDGPAQGLMVYLAEDVTPTVQVGQHVTPSTVIANMFNGGDGIETGWAQPTGVSAESELAEAGGIGGWWCWAYRPRLTLAKPHTGLFRPTTRPSGNSLRAHPLATARCEGEARPLCGEPGFRASGLAASMRLCLANHSHTSMASCSS